MLTEQQAADEVQVSVQTIRRRIEEGRLTATNFGSGGRKLYRIHPDDLRNMKPEPTIQAASVPVSRRRRVVVATGKPIDLFA